MEESRFFAPKIGLGKKVLSLSKTKSLSIPKDTNTVDSLQIAIKAEEVPFDVNDCSGFDHENTEEKGKGRQEEPPYIQQKIEKEETSSEDTDMGDDILWQKAAELADAVVELKGVELEGEDFMEAATPRFKSLTVSDDPPVTQPSTLKRKRVGEDVFTREFVKTWQGSRIKAWESRYISPEGFYYRFVAPGEGQRNGGWSSEEHVLFMKRYNEWMSKGYKIGASWGLFSTGISHRVGYQCMNYYRKLVSDGKLKDESYIMENGKLKQAYKDRAPGSIVPATELGPEWQDDEIKQEEKNVDLWLKEFHGRSGHVTASRPTAPPKQKAAPRVITNTVRRSNIGDLVKKMPPRIGLDEHDFMLDRDPEIAHLQKRDWETEWRERLDMYKTFLVPYLNKNTRGQYWHAKQEWRRGLITYEMLLRKNLAQKSSSSPSESVEPTTTSKIQQSSLSRFFTGVKKVKIDTPDELISNVRIPNDLFSGVKQIRPLGNITEPDMSKSIYMELDNMNDSVTILNDIVAADAGKDIPGQQSTVEGILVDPPWEFYVPDGKNDGKCFLNLKQFQEVMEKVVCHMSAGMVFVWTHKLIQADVVRVMYTIDCKYVENLVWFKKSVNNVHLDEPSPYISSTKEILLMFKKGDGFELRHQRSPDVIIDFEKPKSEWIEDEYTEPKPPAVYDMIETLLPKAGYDESLSRGRFLELWSKKKAPRRDGWISFHENKIDKPTVDTEDSEKLERMEE